MKKTFLFFLLWLLVPFVVMGQPKVPRGIPSPNAAGLGLYGQIPVNYFNGLASISVPLHTLSIHGLNIPIDLSYHASGVRPDHHPGWVGLGWSLNAGGVISRIVNGDPDEMILPGTTATEADRKIRDQKSYLINYGELNRSDWDQSSVLKSILDKNLIYNSSAGGVNPSPDEFTFNFNGYTGSFFLDHTGTWKVRSSNGKAMKVALTTNSFVMPPSPNAQPITLVRIIDKIVLTAPDGIVYTFGGNQESIEFSRNAGEHDETNREVIPTSWFLTKIKLSSGKEVVFNYDRGGYAVINSESWSNYYFKDGFGNTLTTSGAGNYIAQTLINPVYLREIVTSSETITFQRALTNELQFLNPDAREFIDEGPPKQYLDIGLEGSKWYKLTDIIVTDNFNAKEVKKFKLRYKDQPNSRLMLNSVTETNPSNTISKNPYKFEYYDDPSFELPIYTSRKLDHWGFFNNRSYFEGKPGTHQYTPAADEAAYKASRESDTTYMKEGSLSIIQYPTGGQTKFIYEPNKYSYIAHTYDTNPYFQYEKIGNNGLQKTAGGLRISKIINKSGTQPDHIREFFYTEDDTFGTSSGVLGGQHAYVENYFLAPNNCPGLFNILCMGNPNYWLFTNYSILPLSYTQGNHITYSQVKEKMADGGYKVYKYSNHDNSIYRNSVVNNAVYNIIASRLNVNFTDMSYSRGKLLTEETFTSTDKILQRITREYNSDPARFDDAIRNTDFKLTLIDGQIVGSQLVAYKKYLFEPYLSKVTTDNFNQADDNFRREVTTYAYDNSTLLVKSETMLQSDGSQLITQYRYPKDKLTLSNAFSIGDKNIVDEMVLKNIFTPILEKEIFRNASLIKRESNIFSKYTFGGNQLYLPLVAKSRFANATEDNLELQYNGYDAVGNLLSYTKNNSPSTSFAWGYNKTLPIVKANNAASNEFFFQGFEEDAGIIAGISHTGNKSFNGSYQIPFTRPNARSYKLSYFKYIGNVWVRVEADYLTNNLVLNEGVPIDDITIYPADGSIETFTHDPLIGMTSQTDAKGMTTYYTYDTFNRLENIKDQNGDIVKNYQYNYADGTAGPPIAPTYRSAAVTVYKTKNNCTTGTGSEVGYTIPALRYTSTVSQAAADQQAQADAEAGAQANANSLGTCGTPTPGTVSLSYSLPSAVQFKLRITNTATNAYTEHTLSGDGVLNNIPSGTFNLALSELTASSNVYNFSLNGVAKSGNSTSYDNFSFTTTANLNITLVPAGGPHNNTAFVIAKTKTNCPSGTGTTVNYTVAANLYTSPTSVTDANENARLGEDATAQANANKLGGCTINGTTTYYSQVTSITKTRNNCPNGLSGVPLEMSYPAGSHTSLISVADADQQVHAAAQQNANTSGGCAVTSGTFSLNFVAPLSSHFSVHFKDAAGNTLRSLTIQGSHVIGNLPGGTGSITIAPWPSPPDGLTFSYSVNGGTALPTAPAQFTGIVLSGTINVNVVQTRFANQVLTVAKTRNNCVNGEIGSSVNYIVPASTYWAASQTGADQLAQADANTNAQNYANQNGICDAATSPLTVYHTNGALVLIEVTHLTKNTTVSYTSSGTSAGTVMYVPNGLSKVKITNLQSGKVYRVVLSGQVQTGSTVEYASVNFPGYLVYLNIVEVFSNAELNVSKTRNNCNNSHTVGTAVVYTVPAGKYTSMVSQAEVDQLAQEDADTNAQDYANTNGTCIPVYYSSVQNISKTKNDCPSGQVGTSVSYYVYNGKYTSTISQADADQKALTSEDVNAQNYANQNGECTLPPTYYNTYLSVTKTRNNCAANYVGTSVTYTVPGAKYSSLISQADANQKAQADADANAQNYANTNGTCTPPVTYYSQSLSVYKTKNNCTIDEVGSSVNYAVPYGKYTSLISQADANQKAQADADANAQNNANTIGTCSPKPVSINYSVPTGIRFELYATMNGVSTLHYITGNGTVSVPRGTFILKMYNVTANDSNIYKFKLNNVLHPSVSSSAEFGPLDYTTGGTITLEITPYP